MFRKLFYVKNNFSWDISSLHSVMPSGHATKDKFRFPRQAIKNVAMYPPSLEKRSGRT